MGIGVKENYLSILKYSLDIFETVFDMVIPLSIDTCITVVFQSYTLKVPDSY